MAVEARCKGDEHSLIAFDGHVPPQIDPWHSSGLDEFGCQPGSDQRGFARAARADHEEGGLTVLADSSGTPLVKRVADGKVTAKENRTPIAVVGLKALWIGRTLGGDIPDRASGDVSLVFEPRVDQRFK